MTSTLLQPTQATTTSPSRTSRITTTTKNPSAMAWSNEKIRLACVDNVVGLRHLWKLIAMDTQKSNGAGNAAAAATTAVTVGNKQNIVDNNLQQQQQSLHHQNNNNNNNSNNISIMGHNNNNEKINIDNCENFADYLTKRDILPHSQMSLLKFLAINALELSAPASPVLLQQKQTNSSVSSCQGKPNGWMQLSGHPESIVPTTSGVVRKRVASLSDSEVRSYQLISSEAKTAAIVPHFYGTLQLNGELFIELQDLLAGFKDPCVMDIKMGCRTFLESEVSNKTLRPDLYQKMINVDANAPTAEEHQAQAITKLRYMVFREAMSSSHSHGFRIEALRMRGRSPQKDLKKVRTNEQISQTIAQFVGVKHDVVKQLLQRLRHMRSVIERSQFFTRHEIVGSSVFIVYDDTRVGAWLIDFAKSRELPAGMRVNHRSSWLPGNREEGLLKGLDELIAAFERVYASQTNASAC